jgi:2,4-dienoyl-CoA reductase (NADPH2)
VVEPGPFLDQRADAAIDVLVVGGGVAGLECARVAATLGHRVTVAERDPVLGGMARVAAMGAGRARLAQAWTWLEAECRDLGVTIRTGHPVDAAEAASFAGEVVLCTGSRPGIPGYTIDPDADVRSAASVLVDEPGAGPVLVWDPVGGPIGISVAELLRAQGHDVALATPDLIAGNELSRTGDLAPANVRLLAAGVRIEKRSILRHVSRGHAEVEDRFTGAMRTLPAALVVDAGYRLPDDQLWRETGQRLARAGDAVAPRTIHEAILEGRRVALGLASRQAAPV